MTMRDTTSDQDAVQSIAPSTISGAVDGSGVDLQGFNGALCLVSVGTFANADNTFTIELQESDDNAAFSTVNARDLVGADLNLTNANESAAKRQGYIGTKRYIRISVTAVGGTGPSTTGEGLVVRGLPGIGPVPGV